MNKDDHWQGLPLLRSSLQPVTALQALVQALTNEYPQSRKAAVLLPLFMQEHTPHLVFIRRASTLRAHSGEIAFPGGSYDVNDVSLVTTALREASEEIGLAPASVEVLGLLPPVLTVVSNFLILPVVGYLPSGLGFLQAQASEVAEILLLPLHALADPTIAHTEIWTRNGRTRTVHFYEYGALRIWGATGRILHDLLLHLNTESDNP